MKNVTNRIVHDNDNVHGNDNNNDNDKEKKLYDNLRLASGIVIVEQHWQAYVCDNDANNRAWRPSIANNQTYYLGQ